MDIKQAVDRLIESEVEKQTKPIQDAVRKEVSNLLAKKSFREELRKSVAENINEMIYDDGAFNILPEKEMNEILRKAVRSVLK